MAKSRFRPVIIPKEVKVAIENSVIRILGPLGSLEAKVNPKVTLELVEDKIFVKNADGTKEAAKQQGTARANIVNMVNGVVKEYEKRLIIEGTGYRVQLAKDSIQLFLGYAKPLNIPLPKGIKCEVKTKKGTARQDITYLTIKGIDKMLVGDFAAKIRRTRIPDPYKHKGVRYADEILRKKVGKRAIAQA